jgi:hypothetical protein
MKKEDDDSDGDHRTTAISKWMPLIPSILSSTVAATEKAKGADVMELRPLDDASNKEKQAADAADDGSHDDNSNNI